MDLTNGSFFVSDAVFAAEDILLGRPLLQHLVIDSGTILEHNRAMLDGTDRSSVVHPTVPSSCGTLGSPTIARHQCVTGCVPTDLHKPGRSLTAPTLIVHAKHFSQTSTTMGYFPIPTLWISMNRQVNPRSALTPQICFNALSTIGSQRITSSFLTDLVCEFSSTFSSQYSETLGLHQDRKTDNARREACPPGLPSLPTSTHGCL